MNNFIQEKPIETQNSAPIGFSDFRKPISSDEPNAHLTGEKFVVFFLGERLYGISTQKVAEVSQPLPIAFVPNAPEWILGIANLRGEIISILNLPKIFGEKSQTSGEKTKFVVLQAENFDTAIAFPVDKLIEIASLKNKKIESFRDKNSPFIFGKLEYQSNYVNLIDSDKMLFSLILD